MKIFILPYVFYTHFDSFNLVFQELKNRNIDVKYFYIHTNDYFDELNSPYLKKIKKDDIIEVKTYKTENNHNYLSRLVAFLIYLVNFRIISKRFLYKQPDLIILGSDLGGVYIRKIQDICKQKKVGVIVIQTTLFIPTVERKDLSLNLPKFGNVVLKIFGLYRTFTFNSDIPGSYMENNFVFALGESSKKIMLSFGKSSNLIFATGNPAFDYLFFNLPKNRNEFTDRLELPRDCRYIVYFTETIQLINGPKYLDKLHKKLNEIFTSLPNDVFIIIKLHPRETTSDKIKIREQFRSNKYRIIENGELKELIYFSELCILHYSAVMIECLLLRKPILSLNIVERQSYFNLPSHVVIRDIVDLENNIIKILYDKQYYKYIVDLLQNVTNDNISYSMNERASIRIVNLIINIIKKSKGS